MATSVSTLSVIKDGSIRATHAFIESGSLEVGDGGTANIGEVEQAEGKTVIGDGGELTAEAVFVGGGALEFGATAEGGIENLYQVAGSTTFGTSGTLTSDGVYLEGGTLAMAENPSVSFVDFFQSQEEVETNTAIGGGGTFSGVDAFVDGGSFELGGGSEAELELFFHETGTTTIGSGATISAELGFIEEDNFTLTAGSHGNFDELYHQQATMAIADEAEISAEEGYLEEGVLDGGGILAVATLWWGETLMTGTGSTVVSEAGMISAGESSVAGIAERRLVTHGSFSLGESTLAMADGARLFNDGKFNASSEASGFGAQIQIGKSSVTNPRIVNEGEFNKVTGGGTTEVTVPFENNGTIHQFSGTLHIVNRLGVPVSEKFGPRCYCGDPVESASGDFSESQTDFAIGGLGVGLTLTRTYSTQAAVSAGSPGAFGYGWSHRFGDRLSVGEEGKQITVMRADGSTVPFIADGKGGFDPPAWSLDTLSGNAETGYTYVSADQIERSFAPSGALQIITDRNGNETTLTYSEAGRLIAVTDPAEREINITYNGEGLVESAEDPMGHVVEYSYVGNQLASVTLPGETEPRWQFEYDGSRRMTKIIDGRGGETVNEYDGSDRVISQTDPAGRTLVFEYDGFHTRITNEATGAVTDQWFDSNNEPFSITHGFGTADAATETLTYDEDGHLTTRTDGNGHTTSFTYNPAGDRTSMTDADEDETKWEYNGSHDVISQTTPNGETTTIARDANGNPETISRPAPGEATQTTSFEYDAFGQLESMTDPLERTWTYEYNSQGDRERETDPGGNARTWSYDEDSRMITTVSPRGNEEGAEPLEFTTTIERDPHGRPEETINPLGDATKYTYDGNGNIESETNSEGHTTSYTYNPADELIELERPSGAVLKTEYDGAGEVVAQTDGNEETTTYVRNVLEQPIEIIDPLERKTVQEFDDAGNLKAVSDPAKRVATYTYDPADRLEEVSYSDGKTPATNFEYDPDGHLIGMVDGSGESTYLYDQLGRLEKTTNGHGDVIAYEYNLANEQERIVYPNGKAVDREFDHTGRLEAITDWLGHTTTFDYDANSNVEAITFPAASGNVDEFSYDRTDRMLTADMARGPESLAAIAYTHDKLGQVEAMASEGLPGPVEEAYEYDKDNRLIKAGSGSYEYDSADNPLKTPTSVNSFDDASQLETGTGISYEYDAIGERVKATPSSGPVTTYAYDQAGNLTSVKRPSEGEVLGINEAFAFDGMGLMTSRTVNEAISHLAWDPSTALPLLLSDGSTNYIYGPQGEPIEHIDAEEEPTYYHHDQLGSTRLLSDAEGEPSATFTYDAYGSLKGSTGPQTTPLGYAGQYTLSQSGLQYLRARFYDPATAQFLTRDPLETTTREPYAYAFDNPLNATDPSGHMAGAAAGCVAGEVAMPAGGCVPGAAAGALATAGAAAVGVAVGTLTDDDEISGTLTISKDLTAQLAKASEDSADSEEECEITFGHGDRHLEDTGLTPEEVESAIEDHVRQGVQGAEVDGEFRGVYE